MSRPIGTRQKAGDKEPIHVLQVDTSGTPVSVSAAGDGAILDGASAAIRATVLDLTNSNPVTVAITDSNGDQISSFGGGTQYTEDAAAAANPVGTALMLVREDARAGGLTTTDGDNVAARGNDKGELYVIDTDANAKLTTITGHVDGIEGLLTTIDGDTGALVAQSLDYDTGGGTAAQVILGIALPGAGGPVAGGTSANPIRTDPTGTTAQPVTDNGSSLTIDNAHLTSLGGAIAGTEVQVDIVDALPAGTNAIGKLAANSGVDIGDVDVTSVVFNKKILWDAAAASGGTVLTTELNSLADGAFSGLGTEYDNSSGLHRYAWLEINLASLNPTSGAFLQVFMIPALDGTNYPDAPSSTNPGLQYLCTPILNVATGSATKRIASPTFALPPAKVKFVLYNDTNVSLAASGNTVTLYTADAEIQ